MARKMKDSIAYRGFLGAVQFSADDSAIFGKIEGVSDLVTFEGRSVEEAGKDPLKSAKGSFNVRIPPKLHAAAISNAARQGISLNRLGKEPLKKK